MKGLTHSLRIELIQTYTHECPPSPILGLSPLEWELLLDESLEEVIDFHGRNPHWRNENPAQKRGNYYWQGNFLDGCKSVKGKIPRERYLETPQIFVERGEEGYSTSYNPQLEARLAEKLARFKRTGEEGTTPVNRIFSKQFAKDRKWIVEQQLEIVKCLCETQAGYLQTGNPLDLEPINHRHVAEHMGYSISTVGRLVKNLSAQLPDGRVIFADELLPGATTPFKKGAYALRQLQQDSKLYENGKWKVSAMALVPILKERFGIEIARRTVAKYKGMLD